MQYTSFSPAVFNPLTLWLELARKSSEMLLSSGLVIGTRVDRMLRAGPNPSARDRKEFLLMGSEKLKAANASGLAVAAQLQSANYQLIAKAWQQGFATWGAFAALGASRDFGQALARQRSLYQAASRAAPTQARLSGDLARLAHAALEPVHAAATANARRLGGLSAKARAGRR